MSSHTKIRARSDMKDTKIPVVDDKSTEKNGSNVIECSVNMNVSLPNSKRLNIFQRAQSLLIVILAIIFAIVCSHLKREVRALEVQMNCVNSNLMILMLRYENLNKNFNRIWYHRVANHHRFEPSMLDSTRQSNVNSPNYHHSLSSLSSRIADSPSSKNVRNSPSTRKIAEEILRRNMTNDGEKWPIKNHGKNFEDDNMLEESRIIDDHRGRRENANSADKDRYERAILAFETRNHEMTTAMPGLRDDLNEDINPWNESRAGRSRRDEGRGKKRRKIKRRLKRSRRRLGPLVATFVGAIPEQHVTDTVYVGPWVKSTRNESRYSFNKFHLVEDKTSIEVTANGLYMISAQIYYFGEPTHYSYWILLSSEGTSNTRKVIKCATVSAVSASEASCYTSVVLPLKRGDRIHIQQQERDRLINLREGHSYVQIMLLSSESPRRRGS